MRKSVIKALTIDDDKAVQGIIVAFLKRFFTEHRIQHEIKSYGDPLQAAFEISNHGHEYRLILLDVNMPVLPGDEIYNSLSQTSPELMQRIIFVTGYPDEITQRFPESKLNILNKPFKYDMFCKKIATALKSSG